MARIVKVSEGDYIVQVAPGGTITLNTGEQIGTVIMTGNLDVKGTSTTINTTDLSIEDNIITLNNGETGDGITLNTSGIEIYRGPNPLYPAAQIVFDETVTHYNPVSSANANGTFVLKTKDGVLNGLQTNSITTAGTSDLAFDLKNQAYVLKVVNTTDYHSRVTLDNHIPNRKFVTTYVTATNGMADVDKIYNGTLATPTSEVLADVNTIKFYVQQSQRAQITSGGLSIDNVNVYNNTISSTTGQLILNPSGAEKLLVQSDAEVDGNLTVTGNVLIDGNITIGDADTNSITIVADLSSNLVPDIDDTYDIGAYDKNWRTLYVDNINNNTGVTKLQTFLTTDLPDIELFNDTALIVRAFGEAEEIYIGASTGTTTVKNALKVNGAVTISSGDLTTDQTTFNLINTTAETVNFAGAATTIEIGAATGTTNVNNNLDVDGDVTIKGGDLTTDQTTFNLINTTAETVNFAGAATDIQIGAATGTTNVNNNLDVDGDVTIKGGDLTTDQTTFNLINTTASEINIGAAASTINIGALAGTTNINSLRIEGSAISDVAADTIVFSSVLSIPNKTITPEAAVDAVKVYSKETPGPGGTGLYFVNTVGTNDELISKTKSILYSIIF